MNTQETKRNHYNAQVYLAGFCSEKGIYLYDCKTYKTVLVKSLKNIGAEIKIYSQKFEDFLANIDGNYKLVKDELIKAYDRRNTSITPIEPDHISILISFIAFSILRHPNTRSLYFNLITKSRSNLPYSKVKELEPYLDQLYNPQNNYEELAYDIYLKVFEMLKNKRYAIQEAPNGCTFITNDTGIGMLTSDKSSNSRGLGFGTPETLSFFILDKKHCIIFDDGEPTLSKGITMFDEMSPRLYNLTMGALLLDARKYIYAEKESDITIALESAKEIKEYTESQKPKVGN